METLAPPGLLCPLALTALLFQTIRMQAKLSVSLDGSVDVISVRVYIHVFIAQSKCTSIGDLFGAVALRTHKQKASE